MTFTINIYPNSMTYEIWISHNGVAGTQVFSDVMSFWLAHSYQRIEESVSTRSFERSISLYQPRQGTWISNGTLFVPTQTRNWSQTINCDRDSIVASKRAIISGITLTSNGHFTKCTPNFLHYTSCQGPSNAVVPKKWMYIFSTYWSLWITRYVKELRRRCERGFECRYIPTHEI